MIYSRAIALSSLLVISALTISPASTLVDSDSEIRHLLQYIGNASCTFVRNGKEYSTADARAHIEKKYAYAERWIDSTEDFIRLTATKSSMSGKPYRVRCNGNEFLSARWLSEELFDYRNSNKEQRQQ